MAFPPLIASKPFFVSLGFDIRRLLFRQFAGILPVSGKHKADKTHRDYQASRYHQPMSQMHRGLLLRLSDSAVVHFADEAHQPDRDGHEAQDDPDREYIQSGFGSGNNPDAKADNADRDQVR
jgi:hypothetical protein